MHTDVLQVIQPYHSSEIGFESSINVYVHHDVYDTIQHVINSMLPHTMQLVQ